MGVAIIVKREFLNKFSSSSWTVALEGRIASLTLQGKYGTLNIIAVYLDPASTSEQVHGIQSVRAAMQEKAHNIIAGAWNFVENSVDRICKTKAEPVTNYDRLPKNCWRKLARDLGVHEFQQPAYTCETSHGWSRIDRAYTDIHSAA